MREDRTLILKVIAFLALVIVYVSISTDIDYNTQVFPLGGETVESAVKVSQNEVIEIDVDLIQRGERVYGVYAYWDDDKDNYVEMERGFFSASGEIEVPNTVGIHKLTIEKGLLSVHYEYYYEVVKGKS